MNEDSHVEDPAGTYAAKPTKPDATPSATPEITYASDAEVKKIIDRLFVERDELLRKLAQ